jgi:hypothetical protein
MGAPKSCKSIFWQKPTVGRLVIRPATRTENRGMAGAGLKGALDGSSSHDHRSIHFLVWTCLLRGAVCAIRAVYLGRRSRYTSQLTVIAVQQLQVGNVAPGKRAPHSSSPSPMQLHTTTCSQPGSLPLR